MSKDYSQSIQVALFVNQRKVPGTKQPDYKGYLTYPDGKKFEVAAWMRTSQKGLEFISGVVGDEVGAYQARNGAAVASGPPAEPARFPAGNGAAAPMQAAVAPVGGMEDDIPF